MQAIVKQYYTVIWYCI